MGADGGAFRVFALHPFFHGIHYRQFFGPTLGGYFLIRGTFRLQVCLDVIEQIQPFYHPARPVRDVMPGRR